MSNIITFPIKIGHVSDVRCEPLGISFPSIFRIEQRVTPDLIAAYDLSDVQPGIEIYHSLHNDTSVYPGFVGLKTISTLDDFDRYSLVVRHHPTAESATAYLQALYDYGLADQLEMRICRAGQGVFSMINRPTRPDWPAPMIVYTANIDHASNSRIGDIWQRAISTAGDWHDDLSLADPMSVV
ncbi:MAG: hypothetical protein M9924_21520 [Rhizobiaceae bacterium]|nr:hypothetical protein [Rhizobiaceae bacterium]